MVQRGDPTQGHPERSLEDRRCGSWRHESPTHNCELGVPPHLSKRLCAECCVYEKR